MECEQRRGATEYIGEARCRDTRDEYGQQRCHSKVYHKHLKCEHQSGNRSLEDAGNGSCRTAAYKQHQRLVVHAEQFAKV